MMKKGQKLHLIGIFYDCFNKNKKATKYLVLFSHKLILTVLRYIQDDGKRSLTVSWLMGRNNSFFPIQIQEWNIYVIVTILEIIWKDEKWRTVHVFRLFSELL